MDCWGCERTVPYDGAKVITVPNLRNNPPFEFDLCIVCSDRVIDLIHAIKGEDHSYLRGITT